MRLLFIAGLLCVAALVAAIKFLPLWAVGLGAVILLVGGKYLGSYLLKQAFLMPFKMKGQVLKGAQAEVHSIAPAARPDGGEADEETYKDCRYYQIEVTIKAADSKGPFRSWNPEELRLVDFGKAVDPDTESDASEAGAVVKVEICSEGKYFPLDESAPASDRLRLLAKVKPGRARLSFQYYFETFGDLALPA